MSATFLKKRLKHNASNFIKKETQAQVFFCVFWKISQNTFLAEHLWRLLLLIYQKKCIVAGLAMVQGLFSFLFYCESDIIQYAVQQTLTDDFMANPLLLEVVCLR